MTTYADYRQALISQYRDLVNLGVTVQKDLGHKQILATAKRLELYDHFNDHEAMMYAVKRRRFLMECILDQYMYEDPSYSGQSNQITHDQNELSMKIYYNNLAKYMFSYLFIPNQSGLLPIIAYWLFLIGTGHSGFYYYLHTIQEFNIDLLFWGEK